MDKLLRILAVIAVIFFGLRSFSDNKADVDLWGNVGFVKALPWQDGFHYANAFSFTEPEREWINHEWLAEYIFHLAYTATGNAGLLILKTALGFAVIFLMFLSVRRATETGPATFFYFLLVICTMGYGFGTRPHHFTYLLYSVMLFCLKNHPGNRLLQILLFPAIAILWANLHGAFFIGFVMMPGSIYLGLVAGQTMGPAAEWVTIILFAEVARRSFTTLKRSEIYMMYYVAGSLSSMIGSLALAGGPFASWAPELSVVRVGRTAGRGWHPRGTAAREAGAAVSRPGRGPARPRRTRDRG